MEIVDIDIMSPQQLLIGTLTLKLSENFRCHPIRYQLSILPLKCCKNIVIIFSLWDLTLSTQMHRKCKNLKICRYRFLLLFWCQPQTFSLNYFFTWLVNSSHCLLNPCCLYTHIIIHSILCTRRQRADLIKIIFSKESRSRNSSVTTSRRNNMTFWLTMYVDINHLQQYKYFRW